MNVPLPIPSGHSVASLMSLLVSVSYQRLFQSLKAPVFRPLTILMESRGPNVLSQKFVSLQYVFSRAVDTKPVQIMIQSLGDHHVVAFLSVLVDVPHQLINRVPAALRAECCFTVVE